MKIGMTSLTFRKQNIETVFEYAKAACIEGIEWGVHENHIRICDEQRIKTVKELAEKSGIEIFSLGSYCRMTDEEECKKTLETARMLSAPIVRLWAGERASCECDEEYYNTIVENTKKMADMAAQLSIKLCFEYHPNTITDNENDAVKLAETIGRKNVGLYWQPQHNLTYEQNVAAFKKVRPFVIKNIHLNNYSSETGYGYLSDISKELSGYFENAKNSDYNFLIEFVKDASVDSLISDADTVRKIFR